MASAYLRWVVKNLSIGWVYLKYWKIWSTILLGAFMQFIHNTAHNFVYYLAGVYGVYGGPDKMLTDIGFKAFDNLPDLEFWPNFCLYLLGVLGFSFGMSPFLTRKLIRSYSIHPFQVLWRAIWVVSFTITLRCTSFLITILPSPAPHCSQEEFAPQTEPGPIFSYFNTGSGCSDLIFSSHQMYGLIAALAVHFYTVKDLRTFQPSRRERLLKYAFIVFMWVIVLWEALTIVRQHSHYSIDIFTALYAVPMTWIVFYHFFPDDPVPPCLRSGEGKNEEVEVASTQQAV